MATAPVFASTVRVGSVLAPATLDTSLTAPTNVSTILTGVAAGTKIEEIVAQGVLTTVAAVLNIFLYDGSTYWLNDQIPITAVTSSTTAVAFRVVRSYANLIIPSNTWSLRCTITVSGDQSGICVTATGADLT